MSYHQNTFVKNSKHLLVAYAVVLAVNLLTNGWNYIHGHGNWKTSLLFALGITTLGWLSFTWLLDALLEKWFDWKNHATRSFVLFILLSALYGAVLMLAYTRVVSMLFQIPVSTGEYIMDMSFSVLITVIITLITTVNYFLRQWKNGITEAAALKTAILESKFETLKNQVNPHFLFNAFNTLTSLIKEDSDKAVVLVHQLAKVFRYSLQTADKNTINAGQELQVTLSFLQVSQQRFVDKLFYTSHLPEEKQALQIVSHSLLMLVENAIKHNEISAARPLHIHIYAEAHYLCVANTLQIKRAIDSSNGIGLTNMQQRYRHLTDTPVCIEETPHQFIVKIPLLPHEPVTGRR
ncbi:Histidine kinase [Filimonas lacunae]|uniref:Histidine kinase n=1 Tax=Filimonas lacunae TaxID=477680 RepID=A0A173MAP8_9BACT|nr:histidine kinase [Filimonas lacunae]BAV04633.1 autolysis histidine kinase LytS [Filimonas lacunae]SIT32570.1 Histidine kinase [Filimonas lacunae]